MTREAWVMIPSEEAVRAGMPPGVTYPYDFGFLPAMGRLLRTHSRIGSAFLNLFRQIMWAPEGVLSPQSERWLPQLLPQRRIATTEPNRTQSFCEQSMATLYWWKRSNRNGGVRFPISPPVSEHSVLSLKS